MTEKEEIYDKDIAPQLLKIARKCEKEGISFVAHVEWEPGDGGRTETLAKNASIGHRLISWAVACQGNIDTLLMRAIRYAEEHGHSSVYLHLLGVPEDKE